MSDDNNNRKRIFDIFNENGGNMSQFSTDYLNNDKNNIKNEGDTGTQDILDEGEPSNTNMVDYDNAAFGLRDSDDSQNVEAPSSQNALPETGPGTQSQAPLNLHLADQNVVTNAVAQGTSNTAAQGIEQPQGETQERPAKRPRKERRRRDEPEPDYSEQVRARLQNNTRTGQACDRCKERKMKCDATAEGCRNCAARHLPCKVTDRITGETYVRGELQRLRRENDRLRNHLATACNELQYYRDIFNGGQPSQAPSGNFPYYNPNPFQMPTAPPVPTYPMPTTNTMMDPAPRRPSGSDMYGGQRPFVPYPRRPITPVNQPQFQPPTQHPRPNPQYSGIGPHQPSMSGSQTTQNLQILSQKPSLFLVYGPGIQNRAPSRGGYRPRIPAGEQGNQNDIVTPSSSMSGPENTQYLPASSRGTGVQNRPPSREITHPSANTQGGERRPQYINPPQPSFSSSDYAPTQPQSANWQDSLPFTVENGGDYQHHQNYRQRGVTQSQTIPEQREEYRPSGISSRRPSSFFDSDTGLHNRPRSTGAGRPPTARDEREESQPCKSSVTTVCVPGGIPGTEYYVPRESVDWRGPSPYVTENNGRNQDHQQREAATQPPPSSSPPPFPPFSDGQEEPQEGKFFTDLELENRRIPAFPRFSEESSDEFPLDTEDQQQQQQRGRFHSSTKPDGGRGKQRRGSSDPDLFDESDPFRDVPRRGLALLATGSKYDDTQPHSSQDDPKRLCLLATLLCMFGIFIGMGRSWTFCIT
ncbi:hypothetical protein VTN00DRAFT_590 [Thermoascus crustaceus]|uniref:uncharacterized protein n=1 Tax=Thermoascus crustaceus TaxID=5088 RepID=UPI0037439442